jgi:hypothetical protein
MTMMSFIRMRMVRAFALICAVIAQVPTGHTAPSQTNSSRFAMPATARDAAMLKQEEDRAMAKAEGALREMAVLAKTEQEKALLRDDERIVGEIRRLVLKRQTLRSMASGQTAPAPNRAGGTGSSTALFDATKQMQETQMSFNLQYLQLQSSMQNENRQFTMVSNIMKTKHDTVKNSISNIR